MKQVEQKIQQFNNDAKNWKKIRQGDTDTIRFNSCPYVPYKFILADVIENIANTAKVVKHLMKKSL